jgi:hypothetical protein
MKPSVKPFAQRVIENPNQYNLTDEYIQDFIELMKSKNYLTNLENKTYTNVTNATIEDASVHQSVECNTYCDNQMLHLFGGYKYYHGYVSLAVSILNLIIRKWNVSVRLAV